MHAKMVGLTSATRTAPKVWHQLKLSIKEIKVYICIYISLFSILNFLNISNDTKVLRKFKSHKIILYRNLNRYLKNIFIKLFYVKI